MTKKEIKKTAKEIARLENLMREASDILDFEQAIVIREQIRELKGK